MRPGTAEEGDVMLYLFDLDDTLISGFMDNPDRDYDRWEVLPGRKAKLQQLILRGDTCCIVTNQGGVAFGFVSEDQADAKIDAAVRKLGLAPVRSDGDPPKRTAFACYHHEKGTVEPWNDPVGAARRKPSPAMLLEAMREHSKAAALGVLYIGDRTEDEEAARRASVPFQWAHVFFKV
jgi:D-glycero-D-manno-heptose 1,7-bisphosphate phosphatase